MASKDDPPQKCISCGGERDWSSSRLANIRCWDKHKMCHRCARAAYPDDYKAPHDWLKQDCKCPGCGLVHKNPYQQHKLKETQDIGQLKARIAELEKQQSPSKKEDALTQVETVIHSLREGENSTS